MKATYCRNTKKRRRQKHIIKFLKLKLKTKLETLPWQLIEIRERESISKYPNYQNKKIIKSINTLKLYINILKETNKK